MKGKTIVELLASALIVVFLYAAAVQFVYHETYFSQLNRPRTGKVFAYIISYLLPLVHVLLAWLLWRPAKRLAGFVCAMAVMSLYTIYLFVMLPAGSKAQCHCGELWQGASLELNILFNLAVILLSAVAIILMGRFKTNSPHFT
jgi:hypothetical protein